MKAMILAAGRGNRMRPLTDTTPKPLLTVQGKPLIDWHLEKLAAAGFTDVVINVSYLAEQITHHVGNGTRYGLNVQWSPEPIALETGGGIATASPMLGDDWFALISADIYTDLDYHQLAALGQRLGPDQANLLLVPHRTGLAGEYILDQGQVQPANHDSTTRYAWASLGVFQTSLFHNLPRGQPFVLMPSFKQWMAARRLIGTVFNGQWENLSTPDELATLNHDLSTIHIQKN
ncbi:MAG: nucleotidyltransferase family protein [Betaproteobacteria bacterium]|nr:nucleotidyltransferase family protein [Betaproteobacteria bacterium]